jgi:hypothetical protein
MSSQERRPGKGYQRATPAQLHPDSSDIAEIFGMRWRELDTISKRLQRMTKFRWDKLFTAAFVLLAGGAGGAGFGLIPFLSQDPPDRDKWEYIALIGIAGFVAVLCGVASLCIRGERDDSVSAIKEDLDTLLKPYRDKVEATEAAAERGKRTRERQTA